MTTPCSALKLKDQSGIQIYSDRWEELSLDRQSGKWVTREGTLRTVLGITVSLASKGQLSVVSLLAYLFLIRASGFADKQTKAQNKISE